MRRRFWILLSLFAAGPAAAQTCTVTVSPVVFGNYSPLAAAPLDTTGQVIVNCMDTAGYVVALNAGANGGGFNNRHLANGNSRLFYQLYSDSARTRIWGNGTGGSTTVQAPASATLTVYARVPARQNVTAGLSRSEHPSDYPIPSTDRGIRGLMAGWLQKGDKPARQGIVAAIMAVACLAGGAPAAAATASGSFQVRATVVSACRVATDLPRQLPNLGAHHPCLPAPEVSRHAPPPPRVLPPKEGAAGAPVLTVEF
jgi:spore coat protein U-like protein